MGAGSTLGWFRDPLCSAEARKGEEETFGQGVWRGRGLAWLWLRRGKLFIWGKQG